MMTSTAALTWPAPHSVAAPVSSDATASGARGDWDLHRRGSIAPRDLGLGFMLLCVVSLSIGAVFWWLGFGVVLAFAGIELIAVGAALLIHTRHVGDGEAVVLRGRVVEIEIRHGAKVSRHELGLDWLRVELPVGDRCPVVIHGLGQRIGVGLQVPFQRRLVFAKDLRRAVHLAHGVQRPSPDAPQFWS
jgi:uncharacterized membrane protein